MGTAMIKRNAIETDTQPIRSIVTRGRSGHGYYVGCAPPVSRYAPGSITAIRPIQEPGQCGYVLWFEVEVDGVVWRRVNGQAVEHVEYALPESEQPSTDDELPF